METNWNQLIERYLNGELSPEGKAAFEGELQANEALRKELELHQLTQSLIRRAALRDMVAKGGKKFHLKQKLIKAVMALAVVAAIVTTVVLLNRKETNPTEGKPQQERIEQALLDEMNEELQFANIDPQYFKFTGSDDIFLSETGVLLSITNGSFLLNGKPYHGEAIVQWQEAQTAAEIVKAGLSTMSGDKLLETQGMFSLNAFTPEGKQLELSKTGVYVQVPVDELKTGMMLFQGVKGEEGNIDWQNPTKLERLPKLKSMADIDLYPPKYEPKLNELKWFKQKEKRDSLYLSFDETIAYPSDSIGGNVGGQDEFIPTLAELIDDNVSQEVFEDSLNYLIGSRGNSSEENVSIQTRVKKLGNNESELIVSITVQEGFNVSSISSGGFSGAPTTLSLDKELGFEFELVGPLMESLPIQIMNPLGETVLVHTGTFELRQRFRHRDYKEMGLVFATLSVGMCDKNHCVFPAPYKLAGYYDLPEPKPHIPPSKVLAIWNKKLDGTILATQDFEDRMKAIHGTCDEAVFEVYAKNLNAPLWESDEKVVKMGYKEFQQFADERVGKLNLTDEHQKNIQAFYDKAVNDLRKKGKEAVESALRKEREWDKEVKTGKEEEVLRRGMREAQNLQEEYEFNLQNVCKQLGQTVGFQMHGGGTIVNIDKYVMDATVARQSTVITDPVTGKKAKITYNPFSVEIKDFSNYNQLYIYLFSDEINSYQRLDFTKGKLNYNLNGDMHYKAVVIGINENGYFLYDMGKLSARDFGAHGLTKVSEAEFNRKINNMNKGRTVAPMDLSAELKWLFKEQANYVEQKRRRDNTAFRSTIYPTIYSCGGAYEGKAM